MVLLNAHHEDLSPIHLAVSLASMTYAVGGSDAAILGSIAIPF
jgi:hypothetical protein